MSEIEKIALNELLKGMSEVLRKLDAIEVMFSQFQEQLTFDESSEKSTR